MKNRKGLTSICCVLTLMLASLTFGLVVDPPGYVAQRCDNNTVVVQIGSNHASGILFTREEETFVWTAGHVAEIAMKFNGTFDDVLIKQNDKELKARVLRCGDPYEAHDLALLQIIDDGMNLEAIYLKGDAQFYRAFNEVELGQEIIHCGSPFHPILNRNLLFYGNISHIGRTFSLPFMPVPREVDQCSVITYPGCSGGPVFDAKTGDVLGVVSLGGAPGLTVIVPTRFIYEWAKSHDCLWAFDPEVPLPENIVPWRADTLNRLIRERDTSAVDKRWGSSVKEEKSDSPTHCIEVVE